jgi:hypothetical protein
MGLPMQHVEDALVATETMTKRQDKMDYFLSIGLDYDRVENYYPIVCALNHQWDQTTTLLKAWMAVSWKPWLPPFLK